jgi:hypothetical protein
MPGIRETTYFSLLVAFDGGGKAGLESLNSDGVFHEVIQAF